MDATQPSWTVAGKVAFRFFVVYFILYVLPFPLGYIPVVSALAAYYYQLWYKLVPWFSERVLDLQITVFPNGSGDTTYNYVHILLLAIISFAVCMMWSILDRRRQHYDQVAYWTLIAMRYYLALTMMGYGFSKMFMMQFQLNEVRLAQTYGDSSPMGLLWTFMGFSPAYNMFTGMGEVIGGLLLLFRRTTTAGSLLLITIMSNVVILNFTYDVPVKLFSSHLLAMAFVIALWDGKRILNFILNKPAEPLEHKTYLSDGRMGNVRMVGNAILVIWLLGSQSYSMLEYKRSWRDPKPLFHGKYEVKDFACNGDHSRLAQDSIVWNSFRIDYAGYARATAMNGHGIDFKLEVDTLQKNFTLLMPQQQYFLRFRKTGNQLELWGSRITMGIKENKQDSIRVMLERTTIDPKVPLLLSRGFNWINEQPFNR
jgi:uncharacterized membrane protein YphA (DoxX/SURF4 family)